MEPSKRYETDMQVVCWACDRVFPAEGFVVFGGRSEKQVREIGEKILLCASGEKEKEICQWEDENLKPCPHCSAYQLPEPVPQVELGVDRWMGMSCSENAVRRLRVDEESLALLGVWAAPLRKTAVERFGDPGQWPRDRAFQADGPLLGGESGFDQRGGEREQEREMMGRTTPMCIAMPVTTGPNSTTAMCCWSRFARFYTPSAF